VSKCAGGDEPNRDFANGLAYGTNFTMKLRSVIVFVCLALCCGPSFAGATVDRAKRAEEWKNRHWAMFICWSFSTFSGKEWTTGVKDVAFFKAIGVDTDQWACLAMEEAQGFTR
jgi:hypothetical protein